MLLALKSEPRYHAHFEDIPLHMNLSIMSASSLEAHYGVDLRRVAGLVFAFGSLYTDALTVDWAVRPSLVAPVKRNLAISMSRPTAIKCNESSWPDLHIIARLWNISVDTSQPDGSLLGLKNP